MGNNLTSNLVAILQIATLLYLLKKKKTIVYDQKLIKHFKVKTEKTFKRLKSDTRSRLNTMRYRLMPAFHIKSFLSNYL